MMVMTTGTGMKRRRLKDKMKSILRLSCKWHENYRLLQPSSCSLVNCSPASLESTSSVKNLVHESTWWSSSVSILDFVGRLSARKSIFKSHKGDWEKCAHFSGKIFSRQSLPRFLKTKTNSISRHTHCAPSASRVNYVVSILRQLFTFPFDFKWLRSKHHRLRLAREINHVRCRNGDCSSNLERDEGERERSRGTRDNDLLRRRRGQLTTA